MRFPRRIRGLRLANAAGLGALAVIVAAVFLACQTPDQRASRSNSRYQISERGPDYTTYSRILLTTNFDGTSRYETNRITLLENGMNYLDSGVWKQSQDRLEMTSSGAVARQGPMKATFSRRLGAEPLFDLQTGEGVHCRGVIRSLRAFDPQSGQSAIIAQARTNVAGELIPPNQMIYREAFDNVSADVLLTWRHDFFSQDVVLHQAPQLPAGIDPAHAHFEVLTEMLKDNLADQQLATTVRSRQVREESGTSPAPPGLQAGPGSAFHSEERPVTGLMPANGLSTAGVTNQFRTMQDGRNYLVQSLPWTNLAVSPIPPQPTTRSRNFAPTAAPMALATTNQPAPASGFVIHSPILATNSVTTFESGRTYVIPKWYYSGLPVTFGSNCVIKFGSPNSYMLLFGSVTFPLSGPGPVFTSKDDDLFGESVPSMYDANNNLLVEASDGWAFDCMPARALWLYFVNFSTTIRNARFRWAQTAIRYDFNRGTSVSHSVSNVAFENCTTALQIAPGNSVVNVTNARVCNVQFPVVGPMNGLLANDCDVVNASAFPRSQQEPALAVRPSPSDPSKFQIVVVAMDQYGITPPGLLRMRSPDSGATWTRTRFASFADARDGFQPASNDSDPEMAEDSFGNFYLAYSTQQGTAFYFSSDGGESWKPVPGFDSSHTGLHMPRLATGPSGKPGVPGSVWITKQDTGRLTAVGTAVYGLGDVRPAWTPEMVLPNFGSPNNPNPPFPTIAIGPRGQVAVMHAVGSGRNSSGAPVTFFISVDPDGLGPASFTNRTSFQGNLGWEEINAANEVFPFASLAWDLSRDRLYAAYPDKPGPSGDNDDNIDISIRYSNDAALTWSGRVRVNDVSGRSRFQPRVAVDQISGYVAVWWYDCRNDPRNVSVNLFAAISTDLFETTPHNFQVNPKLYQGSVTAGDFKEYMNGKFLHGWFYPVWLDSSNSTANNPDGTNSFDIYLARLPH